MQDNWRLGICVPLLSKDTEFLELRPVINSILFSTRAVDQATKIYLTIVSYYPMRIKVASQRSVMMLW